MWTWCFSAGVHGGRPGTGCATSGRLDGLTGLTPNVDVQGRHQRTEITSRLPGYYEGTVPEERFGEAALNLSQILEDALGTTSASRSPRCGCTRARPRRSSRTCRTTWRLTRSSRARARPPAQVPRPRRGRRARSRRARPSRVDHLGRLRRRRCSDAAEPFGITDSEGQYVINDIRPPGGDIHAPRDAVDEGGAPSGGELPAWRAAYPNDYHARRHRLRAREACSAAAGGRSESATTTYARFRDFGNYVPATLVVEKELEPSSDPGRFDLLVNGVSLSRLRGTARAALRKCRPGAYTVSEVAAAGTNPANYRSTVECKGGTRRTQIRPGSVYAGLRLRSGQTGTCTFRNVRIGSPAIAIDKTGPAGGHGRRHAPLHARRHQPGRPSVPRGVRRGRGSQL